LRAQLCESARCDNVRALYPVSERVRMKTKLCTVLLLAFALGAMDSPGAPAATKEGAALRDALVKEAANPGKAAWQPMLLYLAELHGRSVHPPLDYFRYPYEDIGPGYQGGK